MPSTLDDLIRELRADREFEAEATAARVATEQKILEYVASPPESGSVTLSGGAMKCAITFGVSLKADVEGMRKLDVEGLPLKLIPAVPPHYALDAKAYRAMRDERPADYLKVQAFVTAKAKKPNLKPQ